PVVEEAEIALRIVNRGRGFWRWFRGRCRRRSYGTQLPPAIDHGRSRHGIAVRRHERADAVERLGGDAAAVAQAAGELAVIDGEAAEGRFRKAGLATIVGDFLQQILGVHGGCAGRSWFSLPPARSAVRAFSLVQD